MRCDSHVHIVGPAQEYPQVPERTYLAGVASVETLQRLGEKRGIARFVITARTPGILQIRVPSHSTCTRQRMGVLGAFTPPVTG